MKAIITHTPGGPEVLSYEDVPDPVPGAGEVLVDVVAVGVNRADVLQAAGHYPPPEGTSEIIGLEVSGHIAELGAGVDGWSVGDPVVCLLAGGGYAEKVVVPAGQCVPPPEGVNLVSAAGIIEVAATVVSNLGDVLRPDAWFLVHGGAGGIGAFATAYAKHRGARVIATAGNPEKLVICCENGADVALDYHDDWVAGIKEATGGHGVDVILDIMGAKYLPDHLKVLAQRGHMVTIGLQGGRKGELDLARLLNKGATLTATSLRYRPLAEKAAICRRVAEEIWPLYATGELPLPRETRFPLAQAADAHRQMTGGDNVGKIVLTCA